MSLSLPNKRRSCSNAMEVENLDEILMAILVRMPAKSIFRFQCVCNRWNYLISSPYFHKSFYLLRKAFAPKFVAYIRETFPQKLYGHPGFLRLFSLSTIIKRISKTSIVGEHTIIKKRSNFVNSSNGLILYYKNDPPSPMHLLVFNPITKKEVCLIPPEVPIITDTVRGYALALVCDENMHDLALSYKVVIAGMRKEDSCLSICTLCPKTGVWTTTVPTATKSHVDDVPQRYSSNPLVVDGIIHWIAHLRKQLLVYYMEESIIQSVDLPSECLKIYCVRVSRSTRDDDLWLCMLKAETCGIYFWKMPREEYDTDRLRSSTIPSTSWILMHTLNCSDPAPTLTSIPASASTPKEETSSKSVCRRWRRKGFRYDVPYVHFFKRFYQDGNHFNPYEYITEPRERLHFNRYEYNLYMEPLTLSSYAL